MDENTKEIAKAELPVSVRFMNRVVSEFGGGVGEIALTNFQKRLAQNYFMAIDDALAKQEGRRNPEKEKTPSVWANVNMERLSRDVVAAARVGLDPMENNHISPVLYKNNKTGKYDVGFIVRYKGIEMKAKKYGLDCPDAVIVELVYSTDRFKSIKKSATNRVEGYEFEITNEFDRGEIVGGFFYHAYANSPEKNKLVVMSKKDIDKRKPKYASGEFWGGEVDQWERNPETGKNVKKKVIVDGWYEKMAYKTIYRAAFNAITIDSQKIDDDFLRLSAAEAAAGSGAFELEYSTGANAILLETEAKTNGGEQLHIVDTDTGEVIDMPEVAHPVGEEIPSWAE